MNWKTLLVATTWTGINVLGTAPAIQAQTIAQTNQSDRPTSSNGASRGTGGTHAQRPPERGTGGSRTAACTTFVHPNSLPSQDLLALVPANDAMSGTGETATFWFYVPYASTKTPLKAEFNLQNEQRRRVIEPITITLPETPGIMRVQVPQPLVKDMFYQWSFTITCDVDSPARNPLVSGWVRRVEPSASVLQQLRQAKQPEQAAAIYAQAGLWYDALTLLAQGRSANPQAEAAWRELLRSQQLETVSSQPITN